MILVLLGCFGAYEPTDDAPIVEDGHPCADIESGPWVGHPLSGVTVRSSRYTHDAGIQALYDAMPAEGEYAEVSIAVDNAVVVNVGDPNDGDGTPLWMADGAGGVRTFNVTGLGGYAPGEGLAFTVTELHNYFGELEITALSAVELVSDDNAVHVMSAGASPVSFPEDRGLNAEIAGLVTGESDDDCGDNPCLVIDNGEVTQTVDLRLPWDGELTYGETCMHVIAPVELTRGAARIGATNTDWIETYASR